MVCDLCAKRDARAVSPLACPSGAPLQGSEPDHGKPCTVQAEVDKEGAGSGVRFRACESSRQGATATPTAVLPRPFRVPATNLKPYRGSWPNHEVARNGGGATPDRLVAMRVKRVGRGEASCSAKPIYRVGTRPGTAGKTHRSFGRRGSFRRSPAHFFAAMRSPQWNVPLWDRSSPSVKDSISDIDSCQWLPLGTIFRLLTPTPG
ncbi:hypothetical protein HD554DRAFT_1657895 [Boletus coccyginus]|nr:hypothetical protein HD554DRAFT_1657895 [Boletus coccyginus]